MERGAGRRIAFLAGLLALISIAAVPGAVSAIGAGEERLLGLPKDESVLFAFNSESGSLDPQGKRGRFKLVLRALDDRGLWFADRPAHDAGTLPTARFFGRWDGLGFEDEPPNAALVLEDAKQASDAVALELDDPRFDRRSATVRLDARALRGPSSGLAHLIEELDEGVDRDFGGATLFVDNAAGGTGGCIIGEIDWFAASPARNYDGQNLPSALPADGSVLDISTDSQYDALFSVIGYKFGGDGQARFALPDIDPLVPGVFPLICWQGYFPSPANSSDPQCLVGNVEMLAGEFVPNGYVAAAGGTLDIKDYPELYGKLGTRFGGDGQTTFGVPNLPAPPNLQNAICARGDYWSSTYTARGTECVLSGVDLFATTDLPPNELPANGSTVQTNANQALYSLLGNVFGGNAPQNFGLPNIVSPPETSWGVCGTGVYPSLWN